MKAFSAWLGGALSLAAASATACTTIVPQTSSPPYLNGRLAFQAVNSTGQFHLYLYDFGNAAQGRVRIDRPEWNFAEARNPHLSRDGQWVAFSARTSDCPANAANINDMFYQIYIYNITNLNNPKPLPLLPCDSKHHEDIKFSSDFGSVVFKRRDNGAQIYSLETLLLRYNANLTVSATKDNVLVQDGVERSEPFLSPTSSYVYYSRPAGAAPEVIYRMNVLSKYEAAQTPTSGVNAYYPVVRDTTAVFYTRNVGPNNIDQLYMLLPSVDGKAEKEVKFNDCAVNNNDPAPVDEDYILFSRPEPGGATPHLFIGQLNTTNVWSLASVLDVSGSDPITSLNGASYAPKLRYLAP